MSASSAKVPVNMSLIPPSLLCVGRGHCAKGLDAPDVQHLLSEMLERGSKSAVMEVSSHALALKRVDGTR